MARFSDLPFELRIEIWTLVLPYRGGIHWVEFEGFPRSSEVINKSLEWNHKLFDGRIPQQREHWDVLHDMRNSHNRDYDDLCTDLIPSGLFFEYLYTTVPSVFGKSKFHQQDLFTRNVQEEIAMTRRCRQLSTYTQVATLLSICQTSRLAALEYLRQRGEDGAWPLYRSGGPLYKTRPISIWRKQYQQSPRIGFGKSLFSIIKETFSFLCMQSVRHKLMYKADNCLEKADKLVPTICGPLDLVVYRLHTASGHPTNMLKNASYQMGNPLASIYDPMMIPWFNRVGIEWHSSWATEQGRKELCESEISNIVSLGGGGTISTQLYWLVDGIPRPKWDQYPASISSAFSWIINKRKENVITWPWIHHEQHRPWTDVVPLEEWPWRERLLKHHDLYQEFEANGMRYYVVFVIADWAYQSRQGHINLDPTINWNGPFPGGEDIWPEALRDPVRVADEIQRATDYHSTNNMSCDLCCSYVLSWEPF